MAQFDVPFIGVTDCLASLGKWHKEKTAIVCGERRLSYGEFNGTVNRVANALIGMGLQKGDRVAFLMGNSVESIQTMYGILKAGCVIVPLSTMVPGEVLAMMIADAGAQVLIVEAPFHQASVAIRSELSSVRTEGFCAVGFEADGWRPYQDWIEDASPREPGIGFSPNDIFNIVYTSGTTGVPKGIVQTHNARYHFAAGLANGYRIHPFSVGIISTPVYSNGTWTVLMPTLLVGATLVVMRQFSPKSLLELIQKEKCTHSIMVPSQYIVTLADPDFDRFDLSSLELLVSGSAPLRANTKTEMIQRFKCKIAETYGLSEGTGTILNPEEMEGKIGSVGKPSLGYDIRIIDEEGKELPRGEIGEIVGYGPFLLREYHNRPETTDAAIWRDESGRSYLKSGDMGRLDEDGYLYILDRKKDMIISGGLNVFASDLEGVVGRHEDVLDVAVVAVPHEKWGETPIALVIPKKGSADKTRASAEEIKEWANGQLAKYQRLTQVEFRKNFPRNPAGKILKRQLRQAYWEDE